MLELPFVLTALERALAQATPTVCNRDQGSHFISPQYRKLLQAAEVKISTDGKGRALDNIFTERNVEMATKLIELKDGTLVEVEALETGAQQIAGSLADHVDATLDKLKPILLKACQPVAQAVKEIRDQVDLDQVEIELGLSFESEGNLYITKASLGANLLIRMTLKNV
ncbi:MAG: hypothetical protein NVS4B12_16000 [Ktedonobacteraceae bacterium]